jgi:hypothetical protein
MIYGVEPVYIAPAGYRFNGRSCSSVTGSETVK